MATKTPTPEQKYQEAEIKAQKALSKTADALNVLYSAAYAAGYPIKGADDQRVTLARSCADYAAFLLMRIEYNGGQS